MGSKPHKNGNNKKKTTAAPFVEAQSGNKQNANSCSVGVGAKQSDGGGVGEGQRLTSAR